MWRACGEVSGEPDLRQASRHLAERLSAIFGGPALVCRREVSTWRPIGIPPAAPEQGALVAQLDQAPVFGDPSYSSLEIGPSHWTAIPLIDTPPYQWLLLLPGAWKEDPAAGWLPGFAATASMAFRLVAARETARRRETLAALAYAFTRKAGHITNLRALHSFIVDEAAKTADARLVGLSLYEPETGALAVAATYGYPADVVGDVRIAPGSGIIGGVFASRKPLLVRDATRVPGLTPRSTRYQTRSFMALPIVAGRDVLGVLTLADRTDGAPFTQEDLTASRLVTTLAALALGRAKLAELNEQLAEAVAIDPVTLLFNRRYLQTRLDAELERSRRTGLPIALLMLDVDVFKRVNDQLGHQTGDAVLRKVADVIRHSVRLSDVCTRYGGDEFVVIVPENAAGVPHTAERIRDRIARVKWDTLGLPQDLQVTISIGVAVSEVGESADTLLGRADRNLYQAKGLGRNRVFPGDGWA